jgi:hypothetical protein
MEIYTDDDNKENIIAGSLVSSTRPLAKKEGPKRKPLVDITNRVGEVTHTVLTKLNTVLLYGMKGRLVEGQAFLLPPLFFFRGVDRHFKFIQNYGCR